MSESWSDLRVISQKFHDSISNPISVNPHSSSASRSLQSLQLSGMFLVLISREMKFMK